MGIYVYGITKKGAKMPKGKGVGFGEQVKFFPFKDLGAVVSEVNLKKYSAEELKDKLNNDLEWVKENLKLHFEVVRNLGKEDVVIPFKFGIIFNSKESLKKSLGSEYEKISRLIKKLNGKEEWGIKVFYDKKKAKIELKSSDREIKAIEKKISESSQGLKWFFEKKEAELIESRLEKKTAEKAAKIAGAVKKISSDCVLNDPLKDEKEARDLVFNGACLVPKESVKSFRRKIGRLVLDLKNSGLDLEISGPWPPFNFSAL